MTLTTMVSQECESWGFLLIATGLLMSHVDGTHPL